MTEAPQKAKKRGLVGGVGVLAVQSISCIVILLSVLMLRLVGGSLFRELNGYFREALQQNTLTTAIAALWEGEMPFEDVSDEHV